MTQTDLANENETDTKDDAQSRLALEVDMNLTRADGRKVNELRPVRITRHFTEPPEGSVLIECGHTRVMCTATFTPSVPRWRKDSGLGWVTAEYAMLPRAVRAG